jgi:hypothetical protein
MDDRRIGVSKKGDGDKMAGKSQLPQLIEDIPKRIPEEVEQPLKEVSRRTERWPLQIPLSNQTIILEALGSQLPTPSPPPPSPKEKKYRALSLLLFLLSSLLSSLEEGWGWRRWT